MTNDKPTVKPPSRYWRKIAQNIPDCPWDFFVQMYAAGLEAHPENAIFTVEYRARILDEAIYHSKKIANIQPPEWRAEFAWLLALSNVDGTFECEPRVVWAQAYAFSRPEFTCEKVAQLLDEYARVGLLLRKQNADGVLWGFWVGSDNFQPPPSKRNHYKKGQRDLFKSASAVPEPLDTQGVHKEHTGSTPCAVYVQGEFDSDFGVGVDSESESDYELNCAAKNSENDKSEPKSVSSENLSPTPKPTPLEPTPTPAAMKEQNQPRLRKVVSRDEFEARKIEKDIAADQDNVAAQMLKDFGVVPDGPGKWKKV